MIADAKRRPTSSVVRFTMLTALLVSFATDARAFTINIDPGAYSGRYSVAGQQFVGGPHLVDLAPGTHFIDNGNAVGGSSFGIVVDAGGSVTSLNPAAAQAVGNTLTFNTTSVVIDPGSYTGRYVVYSIGFGSFTGNQTFILIPGLRYRVDNGNSIGGSDFPFDLDAAGNVTSLNLAAAQGSGNTLTFNTTSINIDPGSYTGRYVVYSFGFGSVTGSQTFTVIPGLRYRVDNGNAIGGSGFAFDVDAAGNVTSLNLAAAQGSGNTLTFNTTSINIDPGSYTGHYVVFSFGFGSFTGSQTFGVIPGLRYRVDNGSTVGGSGFAFDVDAAGNVTSLSPTAGQGSGNTLTLGNCLVQVDPTTFSGIYSVGRVSNLSGSVDITLIPSLRVTVSAGGVSSSITPETDEVTPSSFILTIGGQQHTFTFLKISNQPPTADAGPDQNVERISSGGTSVTLDGSGSTDPDEDPLIYTWTGSFSEGGGTVTGANPAVTLPLGTHTINLVVDDGTETDTDDVDVSIVITPNGYSLIAQHSMHLKKSCSIHSGNVGGVDFAEGPYQADGVEMVVGIGVLTEEAVVLKAPNVKVKKNATILGELVYNDLVSIGSGVTIAEQTMAPTSDWPLFQGFGLPAFETATPGALVIDVPQGGSDMATPDAYDLIKVRKNGTLIFSAGDYDLRELDAGDNTSLLFQGPSTLRIKERFAISKNSFFGPDAGSGIDASDIIVYVEGINGNSGNVGATPKAAKVGLAATFQGNLYAQNGTVYLRQNSQCTGSFIGKWAIVGIGADLFLQSGWDTPGVIYNPPPAAKRTAAAQGAATSALAASDDIFAVSPAKPNPFNPETTIEYSLTQPSQIRLAIYNTLGQEVRLLVEDHQAAGVYSAVWDGRDAAGSSVAAGVYLYRLGVDGNVAAGRMVLAK